MTALALKKNSFFSLIVSAIPSIVGLVTVPILINKLGFERFSFLSIIWALIGYFGIFDLGLSRSLNKRTAFLHGQKNYAKLNQDITSGLAAVSLLGIILAFVLNFFGHKIIENFLKVEPGFINEALESVGVISFSIPVMMIISSIKGILEGFHDFSAANKMQLANGLSNFLIPAIISFQRVEIKFILFALFIFRIGILCYGFFHLKKKVNFNFPKKFDSTLFTEGGWLTITSIASPLMVYLDRMLLGSIIALKNLVFYTTPVDLIGRMWIFPQAVSRVTFPTFSYLENDNRKTAHAYSESLNMMILVCLLPSIFIAFFSYQILNIWIGNEMAQNGFEILKVLSVGVFLNCLAWIPYSLLQATNGLVFSTVLVILEVPIYLLLLWFLSHQYGLMGAAIAWTLRLVLDALAINLYVWIKKTHLRVSVLKTLQFSLLFLFLVGFESLSKNLGLIAHLVFFLFSFLILTWIYLKNPMTKEFYSKLRSQIK